MHIATSYDQQLLLEDLNSIFDWNKSVDTFFNPSKYVHICINQKTSQQYLLGSNIIPTKST